MTQPSDAESPQNPMVPVELHDDEVGCLRFSARFLCQALFGEVALDD